MPPDGCPNVSACFYAPTVTTLRDSLVKPLGKRTSDTFEKVLGLRTAGDLLRHYPRRYYTRGELTPLDSLHEGDHVTVLAMVDLVSRFGPPTDHKYGTKPRKWGSERLEVIVTDGPGKLQLVFFGSVGTSCASAPAGLDRPVRGDRVQLPRPPPAGPPRVRDAAGHQHKPADDGRDRRRVRQRADRGLPGQREAQLVADLQGDGRDPRHAGNGRRPDPGRGAREVRPVAEGTRHQGDPPTAGPRRAGHAKTASSGTRRSRCRPRWPSGGWPRRRCPRCQGRPSPTGSPPSSTGGCRSRSPRASGGRRGDRP